MSFRVLFVCVGNIQRSVIAERAFRNILFEKGITDVHVFSRGIQGYQGIKPPEHLCLKDYPAVWEASRYVLEELGISLDGHQAAPICLSDVEQAHVIIAMEESVLSGPIVGEKRVSGLWDLFPAYRSKMHCFGELDGSSGLQDCGDSKRRETHEEMIRSLVQILQSRYEIIFDWIRPPP